MFRRINGEIFDWQRQIEEEATGDLTAVGVVSAVEVVVFFAAMFALVAFIYAYGA